jgi:membrane protein
MIMHPQTPRRRPGASERSLGALFRELSGEIGLLVRQEVALGRAEIGESLRRRGRAMAGIAIGLGAVAAGALVLTAFVVILLGDLIGSYWLAALIVGLVYVLVGGFGARATAAKLGRLSLAPAATLETLQGTGDWARREAADARAALLGGAGPGGDGRGSGPVNRVAALEAVRARTAAEHARPAAARPAATGEHHRSSGKKQQPEGGGGLLKRTFSEVREDDVTGQAAKLAYYAFMAMPPALMAVFALTGIFGSSRTAAWITGQLQQVVPADAFGLIQRFVDEVVSNNAPGPLSVGLLLALWSASSIFTGLAATLNVAYDVEETRPFWKLRLTAIGLTLAFLVLLFGSSALLISGPGIAKAAGLGAVGTTAWEVLKWPLAFAFVIGAFWLAYYFLPNRDQGHAKTTLLKASAAATLIWIVATVAFRLYVSNFSSYSASYGFLGAFILLLLWMYVTGLAVLVGGELASEMEQRVRAGAG